MSASGETSTRQQLVKSMTHRAIELWGPDRADEIRDTIERTADVVWHISENPPSDDAELGFYF